MSGVESPAVSRRQFLLGCGTVGAAAIGAGASVADVRAAHSHAAESASSSLSALPEAIRGAGGSISPDGQRAIAVVDRQFKRQQPTMQKTVDAVKDLGLDPSGKKPINGSFESAVSEMANTRVAFPSDGTFALSEQITARPNGPIVIDGHGCTFTIPPNTEMKSFIFVLPGGSRINNIVIDQSAKGSLQEFGVHSDGTVRVDNVTIKGYAPAKRQSDSASGVDAMFSPVATSTNAVIRATNFTAVAGTAAGTHDDDSPPDSPENTLGSPMGIWVGKTTKGTVQLVSPAISGWSNGIYGGRTKGKVEIRGGKFMNNFNGQVRVGGGAVVDGTVLALDDRNWSKKTHPGPFSIGHQGVLAARVDAKYGNQTDPVTFKNLRVVANSMRHVPALFRWNHEAGPGIIKNCHITTHIDAPLALGRSPTAPAATNILIENCLIDGTASGSVVEMRNRGQSRIQTTCITLPNASRNDITGAKIGKGVSFGKQCKSGGGLSKPKKVGSGGNISSLPAPNASYSGAAGQRGRRQPYHVKQKSVNSVLMVIIPVLLVVALVAASIVAGFLWLSEQFTGT